MTRWLLRLRIPLYERSPKLSWRRCHPVCGWRTTSLTDVSLALRVDTASTPQYSFALIRSGFGTVMACRALLSSAEYLKFFMLIVRECLSIETYVHQSTVALVSWRQFHTLEFNVSFPRWAVQHPGGTLSSDPQRSHPLCARLPVFIQVERHVGIMMAAHRCGARRFCPIPRDQGPFPSAALPTDGRGLQSRPSAAIILSRLSLCSYTHLIPTAVVP